MKLILIPILLILLTYVVSFNSKFLRKNKDFSCKRNCREACSKHKVLNRICNRGSCFPGDVNFCYCWMKIDNQRFNCPNIRIQ